MQVKQMKHPLHTPLVTLLLQLHTYRQNCPHHYKALLLMKLDAPQFASLGNWQLTIGNPVKKAFKAPGAPPTLQLPIEALLAPQSLRIILSCQSWPLRGSD
jgi:hypothetical protein